MNYVYNLAGQVTQRTAANGQITKYSYELDYGRLIGVLTPNGQGGDDIQTWYYWDWNPEDPSYSTGAVGRLAGVAFTRGEARYDFKYDAGGRPTGKRLVIGGTWSKEEQRGYDIEGKLSTMTHPNGNAYTYQYDAAGRMNGMKLGQTTIASVTEFTAGGQWSQWTHDGITETRTYNNLMQLTRLTAVGGSTLVDQEYRYPGQGQNNGRIASAKDWGERGGCGV